MLELSKGIQLADRYTLIRRLGSGGEAETWLAKDRLTAASVALKIVVADSQRAERLRTEWQTSIRLMHAHIARAFEYHADAEVAFYSQQFIDGVDIAAMAGLPVAQVLGPIGLVADAVRYMHAKGLVHRDIKAANILLDRNGAPYLTDFGVTSAVGVVADGGSLISMSPQSLAGQPAEPADDIFALGGVIYELVAGVPAYSSSNTADDIRNKIPAPLTAADGSELPAALLDLVARMLDKDAARRPDAQSVLDELQAAGFDAGLATLRATAAVAVADEAIDAVEPIRSVRRTADPVAKQPATATGNNRIAVVAAFSVLLVLLLGVVFVLPDRVSNESEQAPVAVEPAATSDGTTVAGGSSAVDPEVRRRVREDATLPVQALEGEEITFSENTADFSGLDADGRARFNAENTLGELLSALEILEGRGVARWAPMEHRSARELYSAGDKEYLEKQFGAAEESYLAALSVLEPLYDRIEPTFQKAYADAAEAFDNGDRVEALRLYELAVAITPSHAGAVAGLQRARNLEAVLQLVDQGLDYETDLDLVAAQASFERAIELDSLWEPAKEGLARVVQTRTKLEFDARMSDGFSAIAAGDLLAARAAFRVAQRLLPGSTEPADGLLQIEQGLRLQEISTLEQEALSLQQDEHWDAVVRTYEEILKVDSTLSFAHEGLAHARAMSALHTRFDDYIAEPDRLSRQSVMQNATLLLVGVTKRADIGPRLSAQRDELSRLLKRANTPLAVPLISDNVTDVSIYKVGRLGNFEATEVSLRPGTYVAVGIRPGYRDVRQEFRVAPEIDIEAVVVRCEEQI